MMRVHVALFALFLAWILGGCDVASGPPPELPPPADLISRDVRGQPVECPGPDGYNAYDAEVLPGGVEHLKVTFDSRPERAEAERVLRRCLDVARSSINIQHEMIATAWHRSEGPLPLPDGSLHISYRRDIGEVRTANER